MKKTYITLLSLFLSVYTFSQVGINTEDPKATLDVNGDMRIRDVEKTQKAKKILSTDDEGFIRQLELDSIDLGVVNMESATFVQGSSSDISSSRTPTLDLWTEQENNGVKSLKRYYFLGQNVSVTLPKNISKEEDGTARVITFIVVKNDEFGGVPLSNWHVAFQTKLYQENTNVFEGTNGGVYLYENTFSGSDLKGGPGSKVTTEGSQGGFRRRADLKWEDRIADRELNFYDFGGKWIMTVND